jgi:conjugative transposon TraK protein
MEQLKNIDSAFKHVRLFTMVLIVAYTALLGYGIYQYALVMNQAAEQIYIISDSKALMATSSTRKENIPVEAKDHIKTFHHLFFTLSPDDKVIDVNIRQALYLADRTAKNQYDDLKEKAYYSGIIRGNISQEITCDSITLSIGHYPYYWRYYGKQQIIRSSAILTRSIVTEGYLRSVERSENNPHGFLIERWVTLENKDLQLENR